MKKTSGTDVAFSRNPSIGENLMYREYFINTQGEDIVAYIRMPLSIKRMEEELPEAYTKFLENINKLEHYFKGI